MLPQEVLHSVDPLEQMRLLVTEALHFRMRCMFSHAIRMVSTNTAPADTSLPRDGALLCSCCDFKTSVGGFSSCNPLLCVLTNALPALSLTCAG